MGYTTDFIGRFEFDKPLTVEQQNQLEEFNEQRHEPPLNNWSYYCQWRPSEDGKFLEWDGGEKFYEYTEWLRYIVDNFVKPWGLTLNGEVKWFGEDHGDAGILLVVDNEVIEKQGKVVYE